MNTKLPKILTCCLLVFTTAKINAQPNYIDTVFQIRVDSAVQYAIDTNYAGRADTLRLDLYKPAGDNNRFRPVLIMVHGGAWMSGSSRDVEVLIMARYMAKRGYVVASINYRKGWHMGSNVPNPVFKDPNPFNPNDYNPLQCQYPADTSEIIRANYRGQQDVKSAIRWLRARHLQDSTCLLNYFVGGFSAGGFISLAATYMDLPGEKPVDAATLPNAPAPDPKLVFCKDLNNPAAWVVNRTRSDLGSVEGRTNLNGYSSRVKGVANLFGAIMDRPNAMGVLQGPDTPAIYMYHQECDIIVPFYRYPANAYFSQYCIPLLGIVPPFFPQYTPITTTPWVLGSGYINQYLQNLPAAQRPVYKLSPVLNGAPAGFSCLQNPPCHSMPYVLAYSDTLARFFKPIINVTEQHPTINCLSATPVTTPDLSSRVNVYPNPFDATVTVELPALYGNVKAELFDMNGLLVFSQTFRQQAQTLRLYLPAWLPKAVYLLRLQLKNGAVRKKLVKN
jgi:acetyl esterase/lipase